MKGQENNENGNKPYDLASIKSITGDNIDFLEELISVFISSVSADLQLLKEEATQDHWTEVSSVAHKIKSPVSQFGIDTGGIIEKLESQAGFNTSELNLFVEELNTIISEVLSELKKEFSGNS
jgi:hypothetical protein